MVLPAVVAALRVLSISPATSQDAVELSLQEAQARAEAKAPQITLAAGRVRAAQATRVGAGLRVPVNPRLTVDGRPALDAANRGKLGFSSTLDVLFEVGGAPGARLREAEHRTRVAQADGAVARLEARLQAVDLYVGVRLSDLRIDQARATIALAERLLAAAGERRKLGAGNDIEVTSARVELAERRAQLREAEAERHTVEGQLRDLLALPPMAPLRLTSPIDVPDQAPSLAQLLATARTHPDLRVTEERLALLSSADERLRKEARPKVGLFGSIDASPASPTFGIFGLSVELPFFQRNQGPRAIAAAERQLELDRFAITRRHIEQLLRSTHGAYQARLLELEELVRDGIPAAEARLRLVEEGWRAGRFDIFRLTTAAQDLARLRSMRFEVLERLWQERLVLERLAGGWTNGRS